MPYTASTGSEEFMSEQINKVLASTSQAFTTAEQKQARDNIGAAAASSVGLTGVYHDSNLTGSGTSAEPLGLSSQVRFENSTSATNIAPGAISATSHVATSWLGPGAFELNNSVYSQTARLVGGSLTFTDTATSEKVDISSIQKWNSMTPWAESGNSLGTGFGGNAAVSASQYNYGGAYDNWACREVYADGIPAQQLYGFQTPPASGSSEYVINGNGQFVSHRNPYECHVFNLTGDSSNFDWEQDSAYPTGLPYDMRIDFMVYGTGNGYVLINLDAAGTTADLRTGESATMFYDHTASSWHGQVGNHSM